MDNTLNELLSKLQLIEKSVDEMQSTISKQHVLLIKAYDKLRFAAGFSISHLHGDSIREVSAEIQRYLDKQLEAE